MELASFKQLNCYKTKQLEKENSRLKQAEEALLANEQKYRNLEKELLQAKQLESIAALSGGIAHDIITY